MNLGDVVDKAYKLPPLSCLVFVKDVGDVVDKVYNLNLPLTTNLNRFVKYPCYKSVRHWLSMCPMIASKQQNPISQFEKQGLSLFHVALQYYMSSLGRH